MSKFKLIDCSQTCRMTKDLRESKYCNQQAELINGELIFGCQKALLKEPEEVRQPFNCNFWNLKIYEMCEVCELNCINNKNPNLQAIKDKKKQIEQIMKSINPGVPSFGIDAGKIEQISQAYSESQDPRTAEFGAEAIQSAEWAQQVFNSAMQGRHIDLAFFKIATKHQARRLKQIQKKYPKGQGSDGSTK